MAKSLETNTVLEELHLSNNPIRATGAVALERSLKCCNTMLNKLGFDNTDTSITVSIRLSDLAKSDRKKLNLRELDEEVTDEEVTDEEVTDDGAAEQASPRDEL